MSRILAIFCTDEERGDENNVAEANDKGSSSTEQSRSACSPSTPYPGQHTWRLATLGILTYTSEAGEIFPPPLPPLPPPIPTLVVLTSPKTEAGLPQGESLPEGSVATSFHDAAVVVSVA